MQTVIFFLIMAIAWCIFYLYKTFKGAIPKAFEEQTEDFRKRGLLPIESEDNDADSD